MMISTAALAPLALALAMTDDEFADAYRTESDHDLTCMIIDRAADCSALIDADADRMINSDEFANAITLAIDARAAFLEIN